MPKLFVFLTLLLLSLQPLAATLKIATLLPDGTNWMKSMRAAAQEIKTRTQGRVKLRFYPGGVMGNDRSVLRKIRAGQLHGGMITSGSLAAIAPDVQAYSLPFLFRSLEEVDHVRKQSDSRLLDALTKKGYTGFGLMEGGFVYLMTQQPVSAIDELRSTKVWTPEGDRVARIAFEELGVNPIPLPLSDVLTGLQTGLIESISASPVAAIALQWHTRVKFLTDTPILYLYGSLIIQNRALNRLAKPDRKILSDVLRRASHQLNDSNRHDNQGARKALIAQGVITVTPKESELVQWQGLVDRATARLTAEGGQFSKGLIPSIERQLADFRSQR